MATEATLTSNSNSHHASWIPVGVVITVAGAITVGVLTEGGHYGRERDCRVELCNGPTVPLWNPDGPEGRTPSNPLGNLRGGMVIGTTASSTVTAPNVVVVPATAK